MSSRFSLRGPQPDQKPSAAGWRHRLHTVIFEADTRAGRWFDVAVFVTIGISVLAVCLESIAEVRLQYGRWLLMLEWGITGLFTLEYLLRPHNDS